VRALEHFHKYLYGQEFHLRTDHSPLTWLMSFKNLEGQTTCWIQCLQEYNFTSEHLQNRKQQCRCPFLTTMPRRLYLLPQSLGVGRCQPGMSYCNCSCSQLGFSCFGKGTTEHPEHRAHSGGSRLDSTHNGKTSLTAAPRTEATGPSGNPTL
jgi:hypothetical protein